MPQQGDAAQAEQAPEDDEEFRQVAESVMRECIINLARIKETISQSIASQAPSQGLDSVPSLIRGIKAGLLMLDKRPGDRVDAGERVGRVTDGLRIVERLRSPAAGIVLRIATAGVTEPGADCFWVAAVGSQEMKS